MALVYASQQGHTEKVKTFITTGLKIKDVSAVKPTIAKSGMQSTTAIKKEPKNNKAGIIEQSESRKEIIDEWIAKVIYPYTKVYPNYGSLDIIERLGDDSIDHKLEGTNGMTYLHIAAVHGWYRLVVGLLDSGCDIDAVDNDGNTALFYSRQRGFHYISKLLVERGARTTDQNETLLPKTKANHFDDILINGGKHTVRFVEMELLRSSNMMFVPHQKKDAFNFPWKEYRSEKTLLCFYSIHGDQTMCQIYGLMLALAIEEDFNKALLKVIFVKEDIWLLTKNELRRTLEKQFETQTQIVINHPMPDIPILAYKHRKYLYRKQMNHADGWLPVHYAAITGQSHFLSSQTQFPKTKSVLPYFAMKMILQLNLDVNENFKTTELSPMFLAVFGGHTNCVNVLSRKLRLSDSDKDQLEYTSSCPIYGEINEKECLYKLCIQTRKYILEKHKCVTHLAAGYLRGQPLQRLFIGKANIFRRIEERIFSIKVVVYNPDICSEDDMPKFSPLSFTESEDARRLIEKHADILWKNHENLNGISAARVDSGKSGQQPRILLYCESPDFVSLNENPMPQKLSIGNLSLLTCLVDGYFSFGPNDTTQKQHLSTPIQTSSTNSMKHLLRASCKIVSDKLLATGGIFVEDQKKNVGYITCAHTFNPNVCDSKNTAKIINEEITEDAEGGFDIHTTKLSIVDEDYSLKAFSKEAAPAEDSTIDGDASPMDQETTPYSWKCGYIARMIMDDTLSVGIDAALIMLDKDVLQLEGKLHLEGIPQKLESQIRQAGWNSDETDSIAFANGKMLEREQFKREGHQVIKSGSWTGLTTGAILFDGAQAKLSHGTVEPLSSKETHQNRKFIMKGQLMIMDIGDDPFFGRGDSGSGVFVKTSHSNAISLECIGIAIGRTNKSRHTLVTPIKSVLDELGKGTKCARLLTPKTFDSEINEQNGRVSLGNSGKRQHSETK